LHDANTPRSTSKSKRKGKVKNFEAATDQTDENFNNMLSSWGEGGASKVMVIAL
jgi:hypothetical protein